MKDFRNLQIWKKAHELTLAIYRETSDFPPREQYGLTSQIRRASMSVPSNIAEGYGHGSDAQFARYLRLAGASASELQYQIILANDLGYLQPETYRQLADKVDEVKRMLSGLLRKIASDSR